MAARPIDFPTPLPTYPAPVSRPRRPRRGAQPAGGPPMPVVVVESPAKAKTINGYLGRDYTVLASFGHVRDLPAKDGSVDPEHGFAMEWEVDPESRKHLKAIADALKDDPT